MKNDSTVPKHKLNCKPYEKRVKLEEPVIVLNQQRNIWVPYDFKHNSKEINETDTELHKIAKHDNNGDL